MSTVVNASTTSGIVITGDTSGTLVLQSNGTTMQTIASTGSYGQLKSGTAVSASSTSVDFTGIPSWVKRITVMVSGLSTNGSSHFLVQLGAGSVTTTGYVSSSSTVINAESSGTSTAGFININGGAASSHSGGVELTLLTGNNWVSRGVLSYSNNMIVSGGTVTLSGTLDRVRVTTVNGTDTFDAGSINILYEG